MKLVLFLFFLCFGYWFDKFYFCYVYWGRFWGICRVAISGLFFSGRRERLYVGMIIVRVLYFRFLENLSRCFVIEDLRCRFFKLEFRYYFYRFSEYGFYFWCLNFWEIVISVYVWENKVFDEGRFIESFFLEKGF